MGEVNGNMNQTVGFPDNRTPRNPITQDAPTQSTVNSAPTQVAFNQVPPASAPIVTTKDASGKTLTAHGSVPGTSVTVQNPA